MAHPATQQKAAKAWHWADVKAALAKRNTNLAQLARQHDYSRTALNRVPFQYWPRAQQIIADAIGELPQAIWPDRYDASGAPISQRDRSTQICARQGQKRARE